MREGGSARRPLRRPLIGITPDIEHRQPESEAVHVLRCNYAQAVARAGGTPIVLPYAAGPDVLDLLDGLVISGGFFDIDPALYGEVWAGGDPVMKAERTAFELALVQRALQADLPMLGICGGMQLIAVALGARLIQDIPAAANGPRSDGRAVEHFQKAPCDEASHSLRLVPGTLLHELLGIDFMRVNSVHHQAVRQPLADLRVSALAADGTVEAIEVPAARFCMGVQWHPEYGASPEGREIRLFEALVDACLRQSSIPLSNPSSFSPQGVAR